MRSEEEIRKKIAYLERTAARHIRPERKRAMVAMADALRFALGYGELFADAEDQEDQEGD